MRRILKGLGFALGGLLGLAVLAAGVLWVLANQRLAKTWEVPVRAVAIPSGEAAAAEGRRLYLARSCGECHGEDGAGKLVEDDPMLGTLSGPNLTPGARMKGASDEAWIRAIRHGVGVDGRGLVAMPSAEFSGLADVELGAIIAFLRSLPPSENRPPPTQLALVGKLLFATGAFDLAAEEVDHAALLSAPPPAPPPGPTAGYGEYLARLQCVGCHGPQLNGWVSAASNLTPHPTGLGSWTAEQFEHALRKGTRPDGSALGAGMPWRAFSHLTDQEVAALWSYLRTRPPLAQAQP